MGQKNTRVKHLKGAEFRLSNWKRRILSMVLSILMVVTYLPLNVVAQVAPSNNYEKITTKEELVSGQYVMVTAEGYSPTVYENSWINVEKVDFKSPSTTEAILTLKVNEDQTVTIQDNKGSYWKPLEGNQNGIEEGIYNWEVTSQDETFSFKGTGEDNIILASNLQAEYRMRGYKAETIKANSENYQSQFTLYRYVGKESIPPITDEIPLTEGQQVVLYNVGGKGTLGQAIDKSIENVEVAIQNGEAIVGNGGRIFTVEKHEDYFRFKTDLEGYLCSNGTGSNAFYSQEDSEAADWKVISFNGGYLLESRVAKYKGNSQFLEYFSGSYKTYSKYNDSDKDVYTFKFLSTNQTEITEGIINKPSLEVPEDLVAEIGKAFSFQFTANAIFGMADTLTASLGKEQVSLKVSEPSKENQNYTVTIPEELVQGDRLVVTLEGTDTKDVPVTATVTIQVRDLPVITQVSPVEGSQTGENRRPTFMVEIENAGEMPQAILEVKLKEEVVIASQEMTLEGQQFTYTPESELKEGRYTVCVVVKREDGKESSKTWTFTVGSPEHQLYYGQLHAHTTYSDGSGSLTDALNYITSLSESANVDFVAFTDHSNYFDTKAEANDAQAIYDVSKATVQSQELWQEFKTEIDHFNASQTEVVALGGFEMTWSGGPGHINTFNTPGVVSRNNTMLNNKTDDAGMKAYYNLLSQAEGEKSISQLNHPGKTFGNFSDFAHWNPVIDSRVQLVEVGNGEGAIGSGGHFPSYEQYTMALDKGWHVAPTNNQDNHKGRWGNANDARDVILTDDFTEQGIYDALRERRVYATEDKNLEIYYTLNGEQLGSIIEEKPEVANIQVEVYDQDTADKISKVEVIVNSGRTAHTWDKAEELATGNLTCELATTEAISYYYIRVTQEDGDLAVTAPVWVGETMKLGISSVESQSNTPVTGEELVITTKLFNSEEQDVTVKKVVYKTNGSQVLGVDDTEKVIPASGLLDINFGFIPEEARVMTVTVMVMAEVAGEILTFTKDITLDVADAEQLTYIGIDASHYNEYVSGNYKDSMGNFSQLAAGHNVRTVELRTSEDLIAACENVDGKYRGLILTVPSRRNGSALRDPYANYSEEELAAIKAFNGAGGTIIVAGWSDYYENYGEFATEDHMASQQNKLLAALGSSLRIGDDAATDDTLNGGQSQRLYFSTYNMESFLMDGIEFDTENPNDNRYSQLFSQYGGSSIYTVNEEGQPTHKLPETVTPVVYGHRSTYSKDSDKDGRGGEDIPKYEVAEGDDRLLIMASEQIGDQGLIIAAGAAFMSNFEVQVKIEDSNAEKNYSNYTICENIIKYTNPTVISPIQEVQAEKNEGVKYTVEGIVTSNASGYDKNTAFFDCIYIQDETAGINCFPVSGEFKIGDRVRVTGTTSSYQGERQLNVSEIEKIGQGEVAPRSITAEQLNNGSVLGELVRLSGKVLSVEKENGLIQTILVKDEAGETARIFIDGYITTAQDVENAVVGYDITVTGLASYDHTFKGLAPRLRIRDRKDIICTKPVNKPSTGGPSSKPEAPKPEAPKPEKPQQQQSSIQGNTNVTLHPLSDKVIEQLKDYSNSDMKIIVDAHVEVKGENFKQAALLSIPTHGAEIKDYTQLSITQVIIDEKGEITFKHHGGNFDKKTGMMTAYITKPGYYVVTENKDLKAIQLKIGEKQGAINQKAYTLDVPPVIIQDRTMVPLRFIAEALNAEVKWDHKTKTVVIQVGEQKMTMKVGQIIEGFDVAPMIKEDRTLVPIRYIAEKMGANVIWVPTTHEIRVTQ